MAEDGLAGFVWPLPEGETHASPYTFLWPAPKAGYRWVSIAGGDERWLVAADTTAEKQRGSTRVYAPLQVTPALFRTFADLENNETAFLEFANRYGLLGRNLEQVEVPGIGAVQGEKLSVWLETHKELTLAVRLWDAAIGRDVKQCEELLKEVRSEPYRTRVVSPAGGVMPHLSREELHGRAEPGGWMVKGPVDGDPQSKFESAKMAAVLLANSGLDGAARLAVIEYPLNRYVPQVIPHNLCGCLWLEFALSLGGQSDFRQCEECGEWFEVNPRTLRTRKHRRYCSTKCRAAAYRQRKEDARRMHAEGKKPAAIAKELGTNAKTVRGWIKTPARKGQ